MYTYVHVKIKWGMDAHCMFYCTAVFIIDWGIRVAAAKQRGSKYYLVIAFKSWLSLLLARFGASSSVVNDIF